MPRDCAEEMLTLEYAEESNSIDSSLSETSASRNPGRRIEGVVIGTVVDLNPAGEIEVEYPGNPTDAPLMAVSTARVTRADVGRKAALLFERGDPTRPVLVGLIEPLPGGAASAEAGQAKERLVLEAAQEIVLKTGKASITLTRAGKILLRGSYISSRSAGVNRIKGGSVQIN